MSPAHVATVADGVWDNVTYDMNGNQISVAIDVGDATDGRDDGEVRRDESTFDELDAEPKSCQPLVPTPLRVLD